MRMSYGVMTRQYGASTFLSFGRVGRVVGRCKSIEVSLWTLYKKIYVFLNKVVSSSLLITCRF